MSNQDENKNLEQIDVITLTDDEGNSADFEFLGEVNYEGNDYILLLPDYEDENSEEVVILQVFEDEEDGESYGGVDDEAVVDAVFDIFKEENSDHFDFQEDE